jgi:hypothetical protein
MRDWLGCKLDRSGTRGVAMFACSDQDWFVAVPLPQPVRDSASLGRQPRLAQLAKQLEEHTRAVVALVDRRTLRLLHLEFGGLHELRRCRLELAVDEALAQDAVVRFCQTSALDRFGRIGAIERY